MLATIANMPRDNQLGVGINRGPCPNITSAFGSALGKADVLGLCVRKTPDFVALNFGSGDVADSFIMEGGAYGASVDKKLRHRVDRHAAHPRDRPHGRSLAKHREDLDAGF